MKYFILFLALIAGRLSYGQEINLISLESLNGIINTPDNKLKVINFWASWCRPCILEIPYFEAVDKSQAKVYFVTVDHPEDMEKAMKMVERIQVKSPVFLLNERDTDKYIKSISIDWSGAIPATLFVDARGRRYFHEQAFDKPELDKFVKKYSSYNK
ncbi:MAG: TlpA family protein disulfide reductase [Bacteroidota bacterium]